ncbi:hypothetical protein [Microbulbifer sp. TYP-18]|uniref:hypothetical protein n=1 Tax=Microbulbifer sp. TYP-18 TaxID=3230024 RepID=UPI0034C5D073
MKFKPITLLCSLIASLVSAPSFSLEVSLTWYASALGNNVVTETSAGCIDRDTMWERHVIKANTWNGQWGLSGDREWTFAIFNSQRPGASLDSPEFVLDTSRLHDASGSTLDAQGNDISVTFYAIRPYEDMTARREITNISPSTTIGFFKLDAECDFY